MRLIINKKAVLGYQKLVFIKLIKIHSKVRLKISLVLSNN